jgi:hypothetical protein
MFCILFVQFPLCVVNCYSLNCLMIVNGHQPFSLGLIPVMMIHRNWFRQDNFRFHKLSFCHESSFGQYQIGICLVNSQVKRNGKEPFQLFRVFLFFSQHRRREQIFITCCAKLHLSSLSIESQS